jgi:NAD-dependent dihydropyrimidine dehydrogenase PreA subunit
MAEKIHLIVAKDREDRPEHRRLEMSLLAELSGWPGLEPIAVPHLYDLDGEGPAVERLRALGGPLILLAWLYPRASYWVLEANGIGGRLERTSSLPSEEPLTSPSAPRPGESAGRSIWCFDLRRHEQPESYVKEIAAIVEHWGREKGAGTFSAEHRAPTEGWSGPSGKRYLTAFPAESPEAAAPFGQVDEAIRPRWYPVIDYGRCKNCLECANFCLFGVFGIDGQGRVVIEQPNACRPGCPACSRVCPSGAIMFPQHADPAIAGDPRFSPAGPKLDVSQLFSGVNPATVAAAERAHALAKNQKTEPNNDTAVPGRAAAELARRDEDREADDLDRLVDDIDGLSL